MDLSKLPRLSNTSASSGSGGGAAADANTPSRREGPDYLQNDVYAPDRAITPFLIEAWISVGIGIIILFIFPTMTLFLSSKIFHTRFAPYDAFDAAGNALVDKDAKPQTSDTVTLSDGTQIPYLKTRPNVSPNFAADLVMSLFAVALLIEGVALILSRNPAVIVLAICVTAVAVLANLLFVARTTGAYGFPIWSAFAVVGGGYMVFSEFGLLKWRLAATARARHDTALVKVTPADPAQDLVRKVLGGETKPRCTHYKFAHHALRQAAAENPVRCLGLLQSAGAQSFLNELWQAVRTGCESAGQGVDSDSDGLSADMTQIGPYSAAIVTLPTPKATGEAHLVAVVLRSFVRQSDGLTITRHPLLLYFTLERSGAFSEGPPVTQIGQWEGTTHLSHGTGPNPTASAFRDAVRGRVEQLEATEAVVE